MAFTKSTTACLAGPSFQEGNGSWAWAWARAGVVRKRTIRAPIKNSAEIFLRITIRFTCHLGVYRKGAPRGARGDTSFISGGCPHKVFLSLRDAVILLGRFELFDVLGGQTGPIDLDDQLAELTGELERDLVIFVVHRSAGIGADVKSFIPLQDERQGALHFLGGYLLAVHLENAGAAAADAAQIIKGQSGNAAGRRT